MTWPSLAMTINENATFPVIEVFGPTVQGEGEMIGQRTHFIRFGGCDYACSWCDSMYAVEPKQVKQNAKQMTVKNIVQRIQELGMANICPWVTLSGGNPALHHLEDLVARLHQNGYKVCIETQGTIRRKWADDLALVTVSPKPPSSGHQTDYKLLDKWMIASVPTIIKIVIADNADLDYAAEIAKRYPYRTLYLQPMTDISDVDVSIENVRTQICDKLIWLHEECLKHEGIPKNVIILPQMHALMWGAIRGV